MIEAAELAELEATLLPALERHHLRLLAHGLRTLQDVAGGRRGPLPAAEAVAAWANQQAALRDDPAFRAAFLDQLANLGQQLEAIAAGHGRDPLALDLPELIAWAEAQAQGRLAPARATPASIAPDAPLNPAAPPPG